MISSPEAGCLTEDNRASWKAKKEAEMQGWGEKGAE